MLTPRRLAWILATAYAGLLAAGIFAVLDRRADSRAAHLHAWRAARTLPLHAQLDTVDLAPPRGVSPGRLPPLAGLAGRHLAVARRRGEPVTRADVRFLPDVRPSPPGTTDFVVSLRAEEVPLFRMVDPEQALTGCVKPAGEAAAWRCLPPFRVAAVHLAAAPGDSSWAMLQTGRREDAYTFAHAPARVVLRTTPHRPR